MKRLLFSVFFVSISASVCFGAPTHITVDGYIAAVSEKALDRAMKFVVQKDYGALLQLKASKLVFDLKGGVPVYLEDTKMFSGKVKICPQGSTISVWTLMEAVKRIEQTKEKTSKKIKKKRQKLPMPPKDGNKYVRVIREKAKGYLEPDLKSGVISILKKNQYIRYLETKGDWDKVRVEYLEFWMQSSDLTAIDSK